jgi:hypothetical protein
MTAAGLMRASISVYRKRFGVIFSVSLMGSVLLSVITSLVVAFLPSLQALLLGMAEMPAAPDAAALNETAEKLAVLLQQALPDLFVMLLFYLTGGIMLLSVVNAAVTQTVLRSVEGEPNLPMNATVLLSVRRVRFWYKAGLIQVLFWILFIIIPLLLFTFTLILFLNNAMLLLLYFTAAALYFFTAYILSSMVFPIAANENRISHRDFRKIWVLFKKNRRLAFTSSALLVLLLMAVWLFLVSILQGLGGIMGAILPMWVNAMILPMWVIAATILYKELNVE